MTSEKDIIWVWDTEYDKKQAEQLEKRVKQKIIEEIEKIFDECADKTDIWDNERYDKFRKIFRKELKSLGEKDVS